MLFYFVVVEAYKNRACIHVLHVPPHKHNWYIWFIWYLQGFNVEFKFITSPSIAADAPGFIPSFSWSSQGRTAEASVFLCCHWRKAGTPRDTTLVFLRWLYSKSRAKWFLISNKWLKLSARNHCWHMQSDMSPAVSCTFWAEKDLSI